MAWKRKAPQEEMLAYRSEFAGMVGSMETMASSVVRREMVVFLQKTQVSTAPVHICVPGSHVTEPRGTRLALRTGDQVSLTKGSGLYPTLP